jgi:hypothetical protein
MTMLQYFMHEYELLTFKVVQKRTENIMFILKKMNVSKYQFSFQFHSKAEVYIVQCGSS